MTNKEVFEMIERYHKSTQNLKYKLLYQLILTILLFFVFVLSYVIYEQRKQIDLYKSNSTSKNIDSLQTELFQSQSNEGRYEMSLEILSQYDSVAAYKFDSIYKNETE